MGSPAIRPLSTAAKASWVSLGLALGCMGMFLVFQVVDQMSPFDRTRQGVLTAFLPRTVLYLLWAGEALAVVVGILSFLLIRREDRIGKGVLGIAARSLSGVIVGLLTGLVLWLVVGHVVIGF